MAGSELSKDQKEHILNQLHELQEKNGYLAKSDLEELARKIGRPESSLHGLVSFFDSYRTRPLGRNHVSVCCGTACYACGADRIYDRFSEGLELDEYGTSLDGFITLDKVPCVGACSLAPVVVTNSVLEGKVQISQVPERLKSLKP